MRIVSGPYKGKLGRLIGKDGTSPVVYQIKQVSGEVVKVSSEDANAAFVDDSKDFGNKGNSNMKVHTKAQKYRTESMAWDRLKPGMLVESPGGFDYLVSVEKTPDGRRKITYQNQSPMIVSEGNWLDVPVENLLTGENLRKGNTMQVRTKADPGLDPTADTGAPPTDLDTQAEEGNSEPFPVMKLKSKDTLNTSVPTVNVVIFPFPSTKS